MRQISVINWHSSFAKKSHVAHRSSLTQSPEVGRFICTFLWINKLFTELTCRQRCHWMVGRSVSGWLVGFVFFSLGQISITTGQSISNEGLTRYTPLEQAAATWHDAQTNTHHTGSGCCVPNVIKFSFLLSLGGARCGFGVIYIVL